MMNAREMVYCGDIKNESGTGTYITRVYTTDLSANEALSEIVVRMNDSEGDSIAIEDLTEILATYQDIIYAPVFVINIEQADTSTFVLTGSVYNGLNDNGEPADTDYGYSNLTLTTGVTNGSILAAQNVYPDEESGDEAFVERKLVVDPIVTDSNQGAAFAFRDCDSFRLVFTQDENRTASVTLAYSYDVKAENPLDFTSLDNGILAVTVTMNYDENGRLAPTYTYERRVITEQ
jgi:hypothetical protein